MPSSELREAIITWLDDNYHFGDAEALITDPEMSLLDHGILTSLGFVELLVFLEDTYGVRIDPAHLSRENFDGLGKILRYVAPLIEAQR